MFLMKMRIAGDRLLEDAGVLSIASFETDLSLRVASAVLVIGAVTSWPSYRSNERRRLRKEQLTELERLSYLLANGDHDGNIPRKSAYAGVRRSGMIHSSVVHESLKHCFLKPEAYTKLQDGPKRTVLRI